jgi:hypothetical protein
MTLRAKTSPTWGWLAACLVSAVAAVPARAGKPEERPLLIPIAPLGFQALPGRFISTAATNFTLHFVDENHLLFTFTVRRLLPRLPDQQEGDDDRSVRMLLLELPSGKVLAEGDLRTRDRDRYLWPLDHGRFLLRVRSRLTIIEPLRSLGLHGAEHAFDQEKLVEFKRPIGYLNVSPGGELLGIETLPPRKPKAKAVDADAAAFAATQGSDADPELKKPARPPVQISFVRLKTENADGSGKLIAQSAGSVLAPGLITLPTTGEGFLDIQQAKDKTWVFDFVTHTGKRLELSGYDTSCAPHPFFISRSEFVALGCRGTTDKVELSYFNLKGDEPWISVLSGTQVSPTVVSAPAAGRFALSRTLVASAIFDAENVTADDMTAQEITVMQNYDGRQLLKVQASPIQRVGQNFDLSPDGDSFAVLRGANIEVYKLPPLNGKDRKALEMAEAMAPERNDAPIRLNAVKLAVKEESEDDVRTAAESTPPQSPTASAATGAQALPAADSVPHPSPVVNEVVLGDPQEGQRKSAPSLYSDQYPKGSDDPKSSKSTERPQ